MRSDDGCSCGARKDVARCRCWGLHASASRDSKDALLAAIMEEVVLRAHQASAEGSIDDSRERMAHMMNRTTFIRDVKGRDHREEDKFRLAFSSSSS